MKNKLFLIFLLLIITGLVLYISPVLGYSFADQNEFLNSTRNTIGYSENQGNIGLLIARVINALLGLVGAVFLILIIYGGFTYMTSGAEEGKIKKAKLIITKAIIGFIIIMAAYSITYFVASTIENATQPAGQTCPGTCAESNCGECTDLGQISCPAEAPHCCDCRNAQ